MNDVFYETLQKKDSERCMFIVMVAVKGRQNNVYLVPNYNIEIWTG